METLSNQSIAIVLLTTVIGIGVWLFKKLFDWVQMLTTNLGNVTNIVSVLEEKVSNNTEDIRELRAQAADRPSVKYKRS